MNTNIQPFEMQIKQEPDTEDYADSRKCDIEAHDVCVKVDVPQNISSPFENSEECKVEMDENRPEYDPLFKPESTQEPSDDISNETMNSTINENESLEESSLFKNNEDPPAKISRKDLTLADKIAVLDLIKMHPPNTSHRQLAEIAGVSKSTISRMIQQQGKLREEWALCKGQNGTSQKRKREGKDPDVEKALNEWFSTVSGQGLRVSGPMLKIKSVELAKKLGHNDFKATDGWLSRWKTRHEIKFKNTHSRKDRIEAVSVEQWISTKLPNDRLQCYNDNNNCEDAVVEKSATKYQKTSENQKGYEADTPGLEPVTNQDARKFIASLRRYFMQEGNEDSPLSALDVCADFVHLQSIKVHSVNSSNNIHS